MSQVKKALKDAGYAVDEYVFDNTNPKFSGGSPDVEAFYDVTLIYKGEMYFGSSSIGYDEAYEDLLDELPEEILSSLKIEGD